MDSPSDREIETEPVDRYSPGRKKHGWLAYYADSPHGPFGYGACEEDAIMALEGDNPFDDEDN